MKKALSILLAFAMIIPVFTAAAEASDNKIEQVGFATGVREKDKNERLALLKGLGVVPDGIEENHIMTLGETAKSLSALADIDNWGDNYFKPYKSEQEIKTVQAAAAILDILGYTPYISIKYGEYSPETIILTAKELKILNGSALPENLLDAKTFVDMCGRALLDVDVMKMQISDEPVYKKSNQTLAYTQNIYKIKGIVTSTAFSSLVGETGTDGDYIMIGNEKISAEKGLYEDYIGCLVEAYVKRDEEEEELNCVSIQNRGEILDICADDIYPEATEDRLICYQNQKGKTIRCRLKDDVDVLYNGTLLASPKADDYIVQQGLITLIDNDQDGAYECVRIEEYEAVRMNLFSVSGEVMIDNFGKSVSISHLLENNLPIYNAGEPVSPAQITKAATATYYKNAAGEVVKLYLSDDKFVFTIAQIDKKERLIITDDDTEIKYNVQAEKFIEQFGLGDTITAWTDYYGAVAYAEKSISFYDYGYLMGFETNDFMGNAKLKVFTEGGTIEILETKSEITFNGQRMSALKAFEKNLTTGLWNELGKKMDQLIQYKLNSKNEVVSLKTAASKTTAGVEPGEFAKQIDGVYSYRSGPGTLTSKCRVNNQTKVFCIPEDYSYQQLFKVGDVTLLPDGSSETYKVYNIDDNYYAEVVVVKISLGYSSVPDAYNGEVYIIKNLGQYLDDNGEISVCAESVDICGGAERTLKFYRNIDPAIFNGETIYPSDLRAGDAIQIATDRYSSGEITKIVVRYRNGVTEPFEQGTNIWYNGGLTETAFYSDQNMYVAGAFRRHILNGLIFNHKPLNTDGTYQEAYDRVINLSEDTKYYILNNRGIFQATPDELTEDARVFSVYREGRPRAIVIYK